MKIGLVRRGFSATGGAESYLLRLAGSLAGAGHECTLFTGSAWPAEEWTCGPLIRVDGGSPRTFADRLALIAPHQRCDLLFSLERVWACDAYRAGDGVHRTWLERRSRGEPGWKTLWRRWNPKHRQLLALEAALFAGGGARTVIANSQMVAREIVEQYGYPRERIAVVYNGLPAAFFEPAAPSLRAHARAALGLAVGDFTLLFAGSGWERKGLARALAAVERLPAATRAVLLIAGRGNPRPLERLLSASGRARVRFLGPVKEMPACYAASDLFVLPTLYDPFSNACLEALAAGLPVVTTPANGFAEILTPGVDGDILASPDDAEAFASVLTSWADPSRLQRARTACAAKAINYTIEANVAHTLAILCRQAGAQAGPGAAVPSAAG